MPHHIGEREGVFGTLVLLGLLGLGLRLAGFHFIKVGIRRLERHVTKAGEESAFGVGGAGGGRGRVRGDDEGCGRGRGLGVHVDGVHDAEEDEANYRDER